MKVLVKRIGNHNLPLPKYETEGSSGLDLRADLEGLEHPVTLQPGQRCSVPCGFAFEVPPGYELQVRPRSGLTASGIVAMLGTVDSDYRGEVRILLINLSDQPFQVHHGHRIAQGVIAPVWQAALEEVDELSSTARGANGFGSTGSGAGEVKP